MTSSVSLSAPSRLHFGLFSVGGLVEQKYGGIGLMIQSPRTTIEIHPASHLTITGPEPAACRLAIDSWFARFGQLIPACCDPRTPIKFADELPIEIRLISRPNRHSGLGSGTQLALSTSAAVMQYFKLPIPSPEELSTAVGRGKRSAIGSYGFFRGGFLVDRGIGPDDTIAPLDFHTRFPVHWPVILFLQRDSAGLSGEFETYAFENLPDTTPQERKQMVDLVRDQIIPGVMTQNYDLFAQSLYEFGNRSGQFFQTVQGGPYNGPVVTNLITTIRELGTPAVGQTSWGPCVFAIARDDKQAQDLIQKIRSRYGDQFDVRLTQADNTGLITTIDSID